MKSDRLQLPPSEPPVFPEPREFEVHGVRLRDDYAWLKADNWMEVLKDPAVLPPRIRAHLEAENAYSQAVLAGAEPLRERLVAEMRGRIKEDDWTVPEARRRLRLLHPLPRGRPAPARLPRAARAAAQSEILLDGDAEAKGAAFFDLHDADHSPDHRLLAWSADTKGSELFTIRVRDLATGARSRRRGARDRRRGRVVLGFGGLLLRRGRREASPGPGQAPPPRHAGGGGRARLRGDRARLVHRSSTSTTVGAFVVIDGQQSRDLGGVAPRPHGPERRAPARRRRDAAACSIRSSTTAASSSS